MAKGIYKRGNVFWIAYVGLDGKVIRESSKSTKFKDAETLLIKRRQGIREGKMPEIKRIGNHTFSELVTDYLKWAERQRAYKQKELVIVRLQMVLDRLDQKLREGFSPHINLLCLFSKPQSAILLSS